MYLLKPGFTLPEFLTSIATVALFSSFVVPGFHHAVIDRGVRVGGNNLAASLEYAREYAMARDTAVRVQQRDGNWTKGWTISSGEKTLYEVDGLIGLRVQSGVANFEYNGSGRANASVTFSILPSSGDTDHQRCVSLTLSGKPRNAEGGC